MTTQSEPTGSGMSLLQALGAILRYRRLIGGVGIAVALLTAVYVLSRPRTYTASSSFTPQVTRSALSGLGGLAAQFGVTVPTTDGNQSPQFYADLLRSRTILDPVVRIQASFPWAGQTVNGTFVELAKVRGKDSLNRHDVAVQLLRNSMGVSVAARTGIVRVETSTRYPQLSALLTDSAIGLLNSFNVETRRSQASAQRQFLEDRLAAVGRELADAEDAVRDFTKRNRGDLGGAPELQLQRERLGRAVTMRSQVYSGLAQALEQAKLDEIRDTPLITIIERSQVPLRPDPRGLIFSTLVGLIAGTVLGTVLALVRHAVALGRRDHPDSFAELSGDVAGAKEDLLRLLGPLRRRQAS